MPDYTTVLSHHKSWQANMVFDFIRTLNTEIVPRQNLTGCCLMANTHRTSVDDPVQLKPALRPTRSGGAPSYWRNALD